MDDVRDAAQRIAPYIRRTPLVRADGLSQVTGRVVCLKLETLQRTRAFKYRGACNALLALRSASGLLPRLVTASAGNHGLALAAVARDLGASLTIYVPADAPRAKVDRMRGAGVTIVAGAAGYDEAERRAIAHATRVGDEFISPYNHPAIVAGAGTIGCEVLEDIEAPGAIIVPTGGGGLLSGIAVACERQIAVIGVEPERNPAFQAALAAGTIVPIVAGQSLADGLLGNLAADAITFDIVRAYGVAVRTVAEPAVVQGVRDLFTHERLVSEGAGGIAVGALLEKQLDDLPEPLVLIITGANIDPERFVEALRA